MLIALVGISWIGIAAGHPKIMRASSRAQAQTLPTSTPASCPVTLPNGNEPAEPQSGSNFGNGKLWTTLWPDGVINIRPSDVSADGSFGVKWPWLHAPDVTGPLTIAGRRLDAPAPALQSTIPDGYGHTPVGFQPSAIVFPTPGCWQVTGKMADTSLTFEVLLQVK